MKGTVSVLTVIVTFVMLFGSSCSQRGNSSAALPATPVLTNPTDWKPPVFPGALSDDELQADMTAVAATPGAIDATACDCFGFPVHNAVFHAYRSDAKPQDIMDFYSEQMAAQGWKKLPVQWADSSLPRQVWQWGKKGPLVAYVMVMTMEDGRTLIYLSAAESDSPQPIPEK